jgi:hypothetical protein
MSVPHKPHYFLTLKKTNSLIHFTTPTERNKKRNWESMLYYKQKDKVMAG